MAASPRPSRNLTSVIDLRARLLRGLPRHPSWAAVEARVAERLRAGFAADPPELRRIDRSTPRAILDQIVRFEAVHAIRDWRDLSRRLQADRRCYGLFSASMPDEPLIFTELALTRGMTGEVNTILDSRSPVLAEASCDCAMFYSISSCQEGLRGVPFGNALIRQVVDRLRNEVPSLRTFATVSPVPGFRPWLTALAGRMGGELADIVATLDDVKWVHHPWLSRRLEAELLPLCAFYLLRAKRGAEPLDAVARFHLGNGARLERIIWLGDTSAAGLERSAGITANYLYDPALVDKYSEAYRTARAMIVAGDVESLAHDAATRIVTLI